VGSSEFHALDGSQQSQTGIIDDLRAVALEVLNIKKTLTLLSDRSDAMSRGLACCSAAKFKAAQREALFVTEGKLDSPKSSFTEQRKNANLLANNPDFPQCNSVVSGKTEEGL